jgi:hypothetical protein
MRSRAPAGFRSQLFLTVTLILAIVVVASTTVTFLVTRAQAYQSVGDLAVSTPQSPFDETSAAGVGIAGV